MYKRTYLELRSRWIHDCSMIAGGNAKAPKLIHHKNCIASQPRLLSCQHQPHFNRHPRRNARPISPYSTTATLSNPTFPPSFPATFYRSGTSNGLLIHRSTLPQDQSAWQPILSAAMGSPDPYGRQLNGMGSGVSSTSKVCVVAPSKREDADVDYTFVQVGIRDGELDVAGNCGNMSAAVGPFAWDQGVVKQELSRKQGDGISSDIGEDGDGGLWRTVRIYNTNTDKMILSTFKVRQSIDGDGFVYDPRGDYSIDGVPSIGSRITLSFLNPGGSKTGRILPTGNPVDVLDLPDSTSIPASLIDIANPGVFVSASDLLIAPEIHPDALNSNTAMLARLEVIRQAGASAMGLDPRIQSIPKIVIVSTPTPEAASRGAHITCRAISMQQAHKAAPLTLSLNLGAACHIKGSIPEKLARESQPERVVVEHASGRLEVGCTMAEDTKGEGIQVTSAVLHRTARVLMKGEVFWSV